VTEQSFNLGETFFSLSTASAVASSESIPGTRILFPDLKCSSCCLMVARISIQFATKSSIVTIASLPRMLFAKHMGTMNAV
jgi:hypothetical protein